MSAEVDLSEQDPKRERCRGLVEVCTECAWHGGNRPDKPCVKCGGSVIQRRCKNWPMHGTVVCDRHGGKAGHTKRAAKRRLAQIAATKELADVVYEPITDPIATLADEGGRAVAWAHWCEARVEALHQDIRYASSEVGTEQMRAEVGMLERARRETLRFASRLAELGYEERRVRVEEAQAMLVAAALQAALEAGGVPVELRQPVLEAFAVALPEAEARQAIEASASG